MTTWRSLTPEGDVRWTKYSWGPATANALAIRLGDRGWMIVSAPSGAPSASHEELAGDGGVVALLAPNAYHYLGQRDWRHAFPGATSWAPRSAHARLRARAPDIPFADIDDLELPGNVRIVSPAGQKTTDLLLRIEVGSEVVWWLGDLFSNTGVTDAIWPLRMLSRMLGSGPGYRRNSKPGLVYVRDQEAWLASIRDALGAHPPTIVVPAHGDPVTEDAGARTAAILE